MYIFKKVLYLLPLHPIIELTSGNRSKAYFFVVLLVK